MPLLSIEYNRGCKRDKRFLPLRRDRRTRGHSLKITDGEGGVQFRSELRRNFFTQRVMNLWNSLSVEMVEATSLNIFKSRVDRFLIDKGIKGYGEKVGKWN